MGNKNTELENITEFLHPDGESQVLVDYSELKVTDEVKRVKEQAATLVKEVYDIFSKSEDFDENDKLATAIKTVETDNMRNLLLQVKYSEHIVNTLMRQLDYYKQLDDNFLTQLIKAQNNVINVTMTVSNYVRNLPIYFKQLQIEVNSPMGLLDTGMIQTQITEGENVPILEDDDFVKIPQRGAREMLKRIDDMIEDDNLKIDEELKTEVFLTNDDITDIDEELSNDVNNKEK